MPCPRSGPLSAHFSSSSPLSATALGISESTQLPALIFFFRLLPVIYRL